MNKKIKNIKENYLFKSIPNQKMLYFGIFLSILGSFAELIIPQLVSNFADEKALNFLLHNVFCLLLMISFFILIYIVQGAATYILGHIGAETIEKLQSTFVKHTLNFSVSELESNSSGDLASRLTNDITEVAKIVTVLIPQFIIHIITIIGSVVIIFTINYKITCLLLIFLVLIFLFISPVNKRIENLYTLHQEYLGDINGVYSQKVRSIKIVKSFLGNSEENKIFNSKFEGLANNLSKTILIMSTMHTVVNGIMIILVLGVIILAGSYVSKGIMTFKMLVAYILYLVQLINPAMEFVTNLSELSETLGALKRVSEVLEIPEESLYYGKNDFVINYGNIEFNNVSFSYNGKDKILNSINLSISSKSFVAIVGPSGAGKSTIFSLLMKFYNDYSGEITIDGQPLNEISAISVRKQCSYVLQKNVLFSGSIKDNLIYGKNSNATEKDLSEALNISGASSFVDNLPKGINTYIGEDGEGLSEGQKQRLNISRALVSKPKILFLDEITSSLDSVSEELVTKSFKDISKTTTIVVVAHRLNTIINADMIFVLEKDGHIRHFGTHDELLKISPTYHKMFKNSSFLI